MGFFDKINKRAAVGRKFEEALYAMALQEVTNEDIRPGLWAKAFAESDGNESKAQAIYLKLRVQSLSDELAAVNRAMGRLEAEYGDVLEAEPPSAEAPRPEAPRVEPAVEVPPPPYVPEPGEIAAATTGKFPTLLLLSAVAVVALIGFVAYQSNEVGNDRDHAGATASSTVQVVPTPAPFLESIDESLPVFQTDEPYALIPDGTTAIETVAGTLWVADPSDSTLGSHLVLKGRPLDLSSDHMTLMSITRQGDQDIVLVATQCGGNACGNFDLAFVRVFHNGRHWIEQADGFRFPTDFMDRLRDGISFRGLNTDVALGLDNGKYWFATIGPTEALNISSVPVQVEPLSATDCKLATELLNECAELTTPCEDASFGDFLSKCPDSAEPLYRQADDLGTRTTGLNLPAFAHACAKASQLGMTPSAAFVAREICSGADPAQWEKNSVAASATHSADTDTGPSAQ